MERCDEEAECTVWKDEQKMRYAKPDLNIFPPKQMKVLNAARHKLVYGNKKRKRKKGRRK